MATKAKRTAEAARRKAILEIEGRARHLCSLVGRLSGDPGERRCVEAAMRAAREVAELLAAFAAAYGTRMEG